MKPENLIKEFGLSALAIKSLDGYASINYKITTAEGSYILKYYKNPEELELIQGEIESISAVQNQVEIDLPIQKSELKVLSDGSFIRLSSFVEGKFLYEVPHTSRLLVNLGQKMAALNTAQSSLKNSAIKARKSEWDLQHTLLNESKLRFIENPFDRNIVSYFMDRHHMQVSPLQDSLRSQVIHGDLNENNILVDENSLTGLIDFGDICHSPLINEVAIALTYIILLNPDNWMESASSVLRGYVAENALQRQEIELLYQLIASRLCISVLNSAEAKAENGATEYILQNEKPAWKTLKTWIRTNPILVKNTFLKVCGFSIENPDSETQLAKRKQVASDSLSLSYSEPIHMASAAFQYMFDTSGNTYLDAYNNIPHVGHCHPEIAKVISKKARTLNTNTRYLYNEYTSYSEKLLTKFPEQLNKVLLVNSGSAASDLAIRMAKTITERSFIAVLEHGYHGNTMLGIDASSYKFDGKGGKGKPDNVIKLPLPKEYRGAHSTGKAYALEAISILEKHIALGEKPAAFLAEPISGCGGQVPLTKDYLAELKPFLEKHGILLIIDEVQTGFGRLGSHFWGFELHRIIPDLVILGKPMGNGHPIGGVITRADLSAQFDTGMEFFSSFGGNPISCAIGEKVLDIIKADSLQENALEVGNYWRDELLALQRRFPVMADVRGYGVFIGVEFLNDDHTPATELAQNIKNKMKEHFILTSTDGPFDNVLKMKASLCFSKENVDEFMGTLICALGEIYM